MNLYHHLSLESFVKGWKTADQGEPCFHLRLDNQMFLLPDAEIQYSLSLFTRSILRYEAARGIPEERSKGQVPLLRNRRRMLVGPDMEHYVASFYESPHTAGSLVWTASRLMVTLAFDYEQLASHCIFENLFLVRCKYDPEEAVSRLAGQWEREYDKFLFDEEHSGFTADSRFFEMLGSTLLEQCPSSQAPERQWRLATLCPPSDAAYAFEAGGLFPYVEIAVPTACLTGMALCQADEHPLQYSALAGFLESKGIRPGTFLAGMEM